MGSQDQQSIIALRRPTADVQNGRGRPAGDFIFEGDDLPDETWPPKTPPSARRYARAAPPPARSTSTAIAAPIATRRGAIPATRTTEGLPGTRRRVPARLILLIIAIGLVLYLGFVVVSALMNWWQVTQDDWHYGRPRTFQVDAVVGHNDSAANPSHFIALNLNRHIEIIELPGGDASHARIYNGPVLVGQGDDLTPVWIEFKDVNNDGKVDMIIHIGSSGVIYGINDGTKFNLTSALPSS